MIMNWLSSDGVDLYPCPCCRRQTMFESTPGSYQICTGCGWQDDPWQFANPTLEGGANRVSLQQARENWLTLGVIDEER